MSRPPFTTTTRRHFLERSALALGGLLGAGRVDALRAQGQTGPLPPHLADVTGNGVVGPEDEAAVRSVLFSRRGSGLHPSSTFDTRADVLGRGVIDTDTLNAVRRGVQAHAGTRTQRPITVAWHYGWYNHPFRRPGLQTVGFKGGDYRSADPRFEAVFNDQKNEFGITVDAVSWIPRERNLSLLNNYRQGLFQSGNLDTRHLALLYESTIGLSGDNGAIDFLDPTVIRRLDEHFGLMAEFLIEAREIGGARIFELDRRPVMFIFGTHIWGDPSNPGAQLATMERSLDAARETFRRVYGKLPYIVGEEIFLSATGPLSDDRRRRSESWDATHVYHHASNLKTKAVSGNEGQNVLFPVTQRYVDNQIGILDQTYEGFDPIRNRYTGRPIEVIPNLSPGFAKPGLPTLRMNRREYADFMAILERHHLDQYIHPTRAGILGTSELPAPIYIVGSWNEEFEGHSVFPAAFNESVGAFRQAGFDLPMAIKERFGWNHYAQRAILS